MIDEKTGEIVDAEQERPFQQLDPYAEGGSVDFAPRPAWIATISAGHKVKNDKGTVYPASSKGGEIYVSDPDGRAEHLRGLLDCKPDEGFPGHYVSRRHSLTIAFQADDIADIVSQRFTKRSASALEVYGDQYKVHEIKMHGDKPQHIIHLAGSPEYKALVRECKAETTILFCLAEWEGQQSRVTFPDGLGFYRLRFTSRWSLQSIVGKLEEVRQRITRGRLAGLPFNLSIGYLDVPGPDGKTRKIAVWQLEFRPPQMIQLTSGNLQQILGGALEEGRRLQLLEAPRETLQDALRDEQDADLDAPDDAVDVLTRPSPQADARAAERTFFALVKGTEYDSEAGRQPLILEYTQGTTGSLAELLSVVTDAGAADFLAFTARKLGHEAAADDESGPPPTTAQLGAIKVYAQRLGVKSYAVPTTEAAAAKMLGDMAAQLYGQVGGAPAQATTPEAPTAPQSAQEPAQEAVGVEEAREALTRAAGTSDTQTQGTTTEWVEPEAAIEGEIIDAPPASAAEQQEYLKRLDVATKLGIDLAPFEATTTTPRARLLLLSDRLAEEIQRVSGEHMRPGKSNEEMF